MVFTINEFPDGSEQSLRRELVKVVVIPNTTTMKKEKSRLESWAEDIWCPELAVLCLDSSPCLLDIGYAAFGFDCLLRGIIGKFRPVLCRILKRMSARVMIGRQ